MEEQSDHILWVQKRDVPELNKKEDRKYIPNDDNKQISPLVDKNVGLKVWTPQFKELPIRCNKHT